MENVINPTSLTITAIYAIPLTIILLLLGFNVVRNRINAKVSLGTGGNSLLESAIRAHANACENIPLGLILMALLEFNQTTTGWLHIMGSLMVSGRLAHPCALLSKTKPHPVRVIGMSLTWSSLVLAVILLLIQVI